MPSLVENEQLSCLRIGERRENQKNPDNREQRRPKPMPKQGG